MYMTRQISGKAIPAVSIVDVPEAMADIHRPDIAGVMWHREPVSGFQTWIDHLPTEQLPSARMILEPVKVREAIDATLDGCEMPASPNRTLLTEDIAALSDIFAGIMQTPYLRLRLDVVTGNSCRRFHTDAVRARMICTYRGAGTQYGVGQDAADPEHPQDVPTGSPLLLRGSLWPETPRSGLLHRSPPIEGTGETRLLLVLDPVIEPQAEEEL